MATASLQSGYSASNGIRPINLHRDLGQIADLIEICFSHELDRHGRGAVHEMRTLSRLGPLLWVLSRFASTQVGSVWNSGFVWVENNRVVGNVSMQRSHTRPDVWLMANVAVHPDYRRRGIARALTAAALDEAHRQKITRIQLQVDDENPHARDLYTSLEFTCDAIRTVWERGRRRSPPRPLKTLGVDIRPLQYNEWPKNYELLKTLRPEGLMWNKPLVRRNFQPSLWRTIDNFIQGRRVEHWGAFVGHKQVALMRMITTYGTPSKLWIAVHPDWQTRLGRAMFTRALWRLGRLPASLRVDHPHDLDVEALRKFNFYPLRTLWWMSLRLH